MSSFLSLGKTVEPSVTVPRAVPPKIFEIATFIALGTAVTGDLELRNGIRVDGQVHGRVEKAGGPDIDEVTVHVTGTGEVRGDIVADNVIIEGRVLGSVRAIKHLVVKGFISGAASYGETVELSGDIEATISRLGHMDPRDMEPLQRHQHPVQAPQQVRSSISPQQVSEPLPTLTDVIPRHGSHSESEGYAAGHVGPRPVHQGPRPMRPSAPLDSSAAA